MGDNYAPSATQRSRTMSFNADPVVTQNDADHRYINFANDPGLFCVGDHARCGARFTFTASAAKDIIGSLPKLGQRSLISS